MVSKSVEVYSSQDPITFTLLAMFNNSHISSFHIGTHTLRKANKDITYA